MLTKPRKVIHIKETLVNTQTTSFLFEIFSIIFLDHFAETSRIVHFNAFAELPVHHKSVLETPGF